MAYHHYEFGDDEDPRKPESEEKDPVVEYRLDSSDDEEGRESEYGLWRLFFTIMINPVKGWKELRRRKLPSGTLVVKLLFPVSVIAGVSDYMELVYDSYATVSGASVSAVFTFFTYFLGYFLTLLLSLIFLPKSMKTFPWSLFGQSLSIIGVSTLALFHLLEEVLWFLDTVIAFLPLWTIYIIFKGMGYVKVNESKLTYILVVECAAIICSPLILDWIFSFI